MAERHLTVPVLLSILAAVLTIGLKSAAYVLTGSVGLLSDAAESVVNLVAAVTAYLSLRYAARPADRGHTYGHEKIAYFSSGLEGGLILVAAVTISWYAIDRLLQPRELQTLDLGLSLSLIAACINGVVAFILLHAARRYRSIILEADGQHLLADVWTSVGVLVALGLVWATNITWLDPVIALAVAANILWTGFELLRRSFQGLMDHSLPDDELAAVRAAIQSQLGPDMDYHALRTRQAGSHRFIDFHLLVPGSYSVLRGHQLSEKVEKAVHDALPGGAEVVVHIEPIEERASWEDSSLVPMEQAARRARES